MQKILRSMASIFCIALIILALSFAYSLDQDNNSSPSGNLILPEPQVSATTTEYGETARYTYSIPSNVDFSEWVMFLISYWPSYEVYVDGQSVYAHTAKEPDGICHMLTLPVTRETSKVIILYYGDGSTISKQVSNTQVCLGDSGGILSMLVRNNMHMLLFSFLIVVLGIGAIFVAYYFRRVMSEKYYQCVIWLGIFMIITALWILTDSKILFLLTNCTATVTFFSFLTFLCMPFPLLSFTKRIIDRNRKILTWLQHIYEILLLTFLIMHVTAPQYSMYVVLAEQCMLLLVLAVILYLGFAELKQKENRPLSKMMVGYVIFTVFTLLSLTFFYFGKYTIYSTLYVLGMIGFIFFLVHGTCIGIYELYKKSREAMVYERLAYQDLMTSLGNRTAFIEEQKNYRLEKGSLAYIIVDVNDLKITNDTRGHQAGDELIIQTANCLRNAVGDIHCCYRIGGDEFVACIRHLEEEHLQAIVHRLQEELDKVNQTREIPLSFAVGYAWTNTDKKDLHALFDQADTVMYRNKQTQKKKV